MTSNNVITGAPSGQLASYTFSPLSLLGINEVKLAFSLQSITSYQSTEGDTEYLRYISHLMNVGVDTILTCDGASQGIILIILRHLATHDPDGDPLRAFIPNLAFPSYRYLLSSFGYDIIEYDFSNLENLPLQLKKSDIVFINTPHNPTGLSYEFDEIISLLEKSELQEFTVLLDLVYIAQSTNYKLKTFSEAIARFSMCYQVYSLSKLFGLQGIRSGFVISSVKNTRGLVPHKRMLGLASSYVDQAVASRFCEIFSDGKILEMYKNELIARRLSLEKTLETEGISFLKFNAFGSAYIFAQLPTGKDVGVPGSYFGSLMNDFRRICAASPEEHFNAIRY